MDDIDMARRLLKCIGEDPDREGLRDTPERFLKAWREWSSGYQQDPKEIFRTFEDGAEDYDQMVVVKDLPFYSHCEHHLAPFFGTATIAYIPDGKILGLSKMGRLLGIYSKRLQVQERLTNLVASAMEIGLRPKGVGVVIKARHL
jgi:GTP cyclohydrolase I